MGKSILAASTGAGREKAARSQRVFKPPCKNQYCSAENSSRDTKKSKMLSGRKSRDQIRKNLRSVLYGNPQDQVDEDEDNDGATLTHYEQDGGAGGADKDGDQDASPPARTQDPFHEGTIVYEEPEFRLKVKSVQHIRRTRYMLSDHLYSMWIEQKEKGDPPLLLDLETAIEQGLIRVLDELKSVYPSHHQYQIYVTIIAQQILSGLNSGNYSLNTPSEKIARWMLSMLYHYLKSKQTLRLDKTFKIQIKVLSVGHTNNLMQNNAKFRRHVYH